MQSVVESARGEEDARDAAHTYQRIPTCAFTYIFIYFRQYTELVYILPVRCMYVHTHARAYSCRIFKAVDDGDSDGWWR